MVWRRPGQNGDVGLPVGNNCCSSLPHSNVGHLGSSIDGRGSSLGRRDFDFVPGVGEDAVRSSGFFKPIACGGGGSGGSSRVKSFFHHNRESVKMRMKNAHERRRDSKSDPNLGEPRAQAPNERVKCLQQVQQYPATSISSFMTH